MVPVDPASSFWAIDPGILAADLQGPVTAPYWAGGVLVGPAEANELQTYFSTDNLQMEWVLPLDTSSLDGQQVQPLSDALDKISTQVPALSGISAACRSHHDRLLGHAVLAQQRSSPPRSRLIRCSGCST